MKIIVAASDRQAFNEALRLQLPRTDFIIASSTRVVEGRAINPEDVIYVEGFRSRVDAVRIEEAIAGQVARSGLWKR